MRDYRYDIREGRNKQAKRGKWYVQSSDRR